MRNETATEFSVTVSRIATADMLYAIRKLASGKSVLYKIMTVVIDGPAGAVEQLRIDSKLRVEVDPQHPGHVVRARIVASSHSRAVKSSVQKVLAGKAHHR